MSAATPGGPHGTRRDSVGARRPARALAVLGVVVVLLGGAVAALWWLDHRHNQVQAARQAALQSAPQRAETVLSYDHRSLDQDLRRARAALTGPYREEFGREADQVTAPAARQQRVSTRATVVASGVVRAEPDEVVVLLFVNQATESARSRAVQLSSHRIELTLTRVDGQWLISALERV